MDFQPWVYYFRGLWSIGRGEPHALEVLQVQGYKIFLCFNINIFSLKVRIAKTKVKNGPDPVYDEEFDLDDIPPDVLTIAVTIFNKVQ